MLVYGLEITSSTGRLFGCVLVSLTASFHSFAARNSVGGVECGPMENTIRNRGEVCGLAFGSAGEASADVHRLARVCADEIAGKRFRKGLIDADSIEDAAAVIQAQIYRE